MSNVEKLKKKAAEFEQKKQFDKALEVYLQIIGHSEGQEDRDVTVYNRVGDLYLRLNKTDQAVNYYEQAVDLYTDGGYLNNAIALCNKILRHAPARHQIYYKLGKISAKKGFNSDAKKNFLEFADRMHRAGKDTEAFKALQEFADLCPGQDDIRLMLADQLAKAGKTAEAIEQLQILHESLDSEGRTAEAEATVQRIHSLDPAVEPRRSKTPVQRDSGGLVFLDVGASPVKPRPKVEGLQRTSIPRPAPARPKTPPHVQPSPEFETLPDIEPSPEEALPALEIETTSLAGLEPTSNEAEIEPASTEPEIEPHFDLSINDIDVSPLEGLESAADQSQFAIDPSVNEVNEVPSAVEGLISDETVELSGAAGAAHVDSSEGPALGEPLSTEDPLAGLNLLEDDRFFVHEEQPEASGSEAETVPESASPVSQDEVPPIEAMDFQIEHVELEAETPAAHQAHPEARHEPDAQTSGDRDAELEEEHLRERHQEAEVRHPTPARQERQQVRATAQHHEPEQQESEDAEPEHHEQRSRHEQPARRQEAAHDRDAERDEPPSRPSRPSLRVEPPTHAPAARTQKPAANLEPEEEDVEAEEDYEETQETEELEYLEEERPAAKANKPKLVPPLRMTRPKPKKPKTPIKEAPAERQPVNPFLRQRTKPKAPSPKASQRVATPPAEVPRAATPKENTPPKSTDNFVDLADWLREDRGPRSYRMVAEEDHNRQEGEEADFTDMLEKFKAGVAANVDDEDFDSHYDLGVAYKEMGLIEEAIAEFQKALRGATQRIRAYEALGQCFIDRNDFDTAITVLGRALREPGMEDEDLIGVLYLLGFSSEGSKKPRDAAAYYQRVFAIDIDFRDVSKRLKQMTKAASK